MKLLVYLLAIYLYFKFFRTDHLKNWLEYRMVKKMAIHSCKKIYLSNGTTGSLDCFTEIYQRYWRIYKKRYLDEKRSEAVNSEIPFDEAIARNLTSFEQVAVNPFLARVKLGENSISEWADCDDDNFANRGSALFFYAFVLETIAILDRITVIKNSDRVAEALKDDRERMRLNWEIAKDMRLLIEQGLYHGVIDKLKPV